METSAIQSLNTTPKEHVMTIHYTSTAHATGYHLSACGRSVFCLNLTDNRRRVTCLKCRGTYAFRGITPESAVVESTRTRTADASTQAIVEDIFSALNEWAEEAGHCSSYDEAVEVAQVAAHKYGVIVPEREMVWSISLHGYEVRAATSQAALEKIKENIGEYITIYG
jgi:hypothetical protein